MLSFLPFLTLFALLLASLLIGAANAADDDNKMSNQQIDYEWWRTQAPIQFSQGYQDNMVLQQAPASASVTGHLGHVDCPENPADRPMVVVSIHVDKEDYDDYPSPAIYSVGAEVYPETNLGGKYCSFRAIFPPSKMGGAYTFEARYMNSGSSSKKFTVGESVEGDRQMEGEYYSGVVTEISPGHITVQYDDDASIEILPISSVRPKIFIVGESVEGDWQMEGEYYSGVVNAISPHKITIQYDDDATLETLPIRFVRHKFTYATDKIRHVTFGEVWFCSGQSNMALELKHTLAWEESIKKVASGSYDNIRIHGLEGNMNKDQPWKAVNDANADGTLQYYSSTCYYFAEKLTDEFRTNGQTPPPIGLVHTAWGGSTIEDWVNNETLAVCSDTCHEQTRGNVGGVDRRGYSLMEWHALPYVNMTIKGWLWYQAENNMNMVPKCVLGNSERNQGYSCLMVGLVRLWRKLWSATPGTTDPLAPFGVVALPLSGSEGNPNIGLMRWAQTGGYGVLPSEAMPNTFLVQSYDLEDPYRGAFDLCLHGECCYPGKSFSFGNGDPKQCVDSKYQTDTYAGFQCSMCDELCGDFCASAYATNFYMGPIHPRLKYPVGSRLAEATAKSVYRMRGGSNHAGLGNGATTGPTIAGCTVDEEAKLVRVFFNATLLAGDSVIVQNYNRSIAGRSKMEVLVATNTAKNRLCLDVTSGECVDDGHGNKFPWQGEASKAKWIPVHILSQRSATNREFEVVVRLGSIEVTENIMAIRYAWEGTCCWSEHEERTLETLSRKCPPKACPIYSASSELPANPFLAEIINGTCKCLSPQVCDGDGSLPPDLTSPISSLGILSRIKHLMPSNSSPSKSSSGLTAWMGSRVGTIALSVFVVAGILLFTTYRRRHRQNKAAEEADESEMVELVW